MNKRLTAFVLVAYGIGFFLGFESGGFQLVLLQIARFYNLNNVEMGSLVTAELSAITLGPLLRLDRGPRGEKSNTADFYASFYGRMFCRRLFNRHCHFCVFNFCGRNRVQFE